MENLYKIKPLCWTQEYCSEYYKKDAVYIARTSIGDYVIIPFVDNCALKVLAVIGMFPDRNSGASEGKRRRTLPGRATKALNPCQAQQLEKADGRSYDVIAMMMRMLIVNYRNKLADIAEQLRKDLPESKVVTRRRKSAFEMNMGALSSAFLSDDDKPSEYWEKESWPVLERLEKMIIDLDLDADSMMTVEVINEQREQQT